MSRYLASPHFHGSARLRTALWKNVPPVASSNMRCPFHALRDVSPPLMRGKNPDLEFAHVLGNARSYSTRASKSHEKYEKISKESNRMRKQHSETSAESNTSQASEAQSAIAPESNGKAPEVLSGINKDRPSVDAMLEWHAQRVQQQSLSSGELFASFAKMNRERRPHNQGKNVRKTPASKKDSAPRKTSATSPPQAVNSGPLNQRQRQPKPVKGVERQHPYVWSDEFKEIILLMQKCVKNYRSWSQDKLVTAVLEALKEDPNQVKGLLVNTIQFANYNFRGIDGMEENGRKVCRALVECMPTEKDKIAILTSTAKFNTTVFHEAVKCGHWDTFDELAALCAELMCVLIVGVFVLESTPLVDLMFVYRGNITF